MKDTSMPLIFYNIPKYHAGLTSAEIRFDHPWVNRGQQNTDWLPYLKRVGCLAQHFPKIKYLTRMKVMGIHADSSETFCPTIISLILTRIESLEIRFSLRGEFDAVRGDPNDETAERVEFFTSLETTWLSQKHAQQLRSITIDCSSFFWGSTPKFNIKNVSFDNLVSLDLGYFCFGSEDQITAICSLKRLKRLRLTDTCILYASVQADHTAPNLTGLERCKTFWFSWAGFFTRLLALDLEYLDISFPSGDYDPTLCTDRWTNRYMTYDQYSRKRGDPGSGWSNYLRRAPHPDDMPPWKAPKYPQFVRLEIMDWSAFVRLLSGIRKSWKWAYKTPDDEFDRKLYRKVRNKGVIRDYYAVGTELSEVVYWDGEGDQEVKGEALRVEDSMINAEGKEVPSMDKKDLWIRCTIRRNLLLNGYVDSAGSDYCRDRRCPCFPENIV